ncbi:MAG: hypothetical protein BJ554DRAFT_4809, partial [Olpidium bornovanus]
MKFSAVIMLALVGTALTVAAAPAPGYGKNLKNVAANNKALKNANNAAVKTNKYSNNVAVNQGFKYNQAKKNTNKNSKAYKKNYNNAAKKNNKKNANVKNYGKGK